MNEGRRDGVRHASSRRFVFWLLLVASWIALLPFLWSAFSDVPSPERLEQQRTVEIPTLATLARTIRRWLAGMIVLLLFAAVIASVARLRPRA